MSKGFAPVSCALRVAAGLLIFSAFGGTALAVDIVPEISPQSMASAVALLAGGGMLLAGRLFRRSR